MLLKFWFYSGSGMARSRRFLSYVEVVEDLCRGGMSVEDAFALYPLESVLADLGQFASEYDIHTFVYRCLEEMTECCFTYAMLRRGTSGDGPWSEPLRGEGDW